MDIILRTFPTCATRERSEREIKMDTTFIQENSVFLQIIVTILSWATLENFVITQFSYQLRYAAHNGAISYVKR